MKTRILNIVADEAVSRLLDESMPSGAVLRTVASAGEALAALETFAPAIIFVDRSVPDVANGGVIETLLKDERCSDTVFLALTDDDSQEARIKAYTQGFYDILKKPVNPAELQLKASRWNKIAHMISLSQLKTELIELMVDDTLSPFGPVVQAADWLENAEAEVKRDDVAPIITAIENSSEGFLTQLGLLIEYTELVGGQTDLNLCAFSLQSILGAQYDRWRQICARNDLKFTMGKVEPDVQVFADSKILGRVLRWLFKNAVEHAENVVEVKAGAIGESEGYIDFIDDGPGFTKDSLPLVLNGFQPGNRFNVDKGIGLHLSLAQAFMDGQNGALIITKPGPGGTTVRVVTQAQPATRGKGS